MKAWFTTLIPQTRATWGLILTPYTMHKNLISISTSHGWSRVCGILCVPHYEKTNESFLQSDVTRIDEGVWHP